MDTVQSADGTAIAFDRSGSGPAVILIGGAFNDRSTVSGLAASLAPHFTVYAYDRRGRGASGDTAPFSVEREMEDLDALITEAGGSAAVFGHSSGGVLALEAASRGLRIGRLVVYEPSYLHDGSARRPAADLLDRVRDAVAAGRRTEAVQLFLTEAVGVPAEVVAMMQGDPAWAAMEALAHTLPYDLALHPRGQYVPTERLARIRTPTLVLDGGASSEETRLSARAVAAAVPAAERLTVEGQDHGVLHQPEVLVPILLRFASGPDRHGPGRGSL